MSITEHISKRPFVEAIANVMEKRLRDNDWKNERTWKNRTQITAKLLEELTELFRSLDSPMDHAHGVPLEKDGAMELILSEAADVCNLVGMLALYEDPNCRVIPSYREPARKEVEVNKKKEQEKKKPEKSKQEMVEEIGEYFGVKNHHGFQGVFKSNLESILLTLFSCSLKCLPYDNDGRVKVEWTLVDSKYEKTYRKTGYYVFDTFIEVVYDFMNDLKGYDEKV